MHFVDGGAGKEPLLLLFGQVLLLTLDILTAGCFAQGRVEVFHVVGLEFLHLHRVCELSVPNHVHFKLLELLKTQRQNLSENSGSILRLFSFSILFASFDNSVPVSAAKVYGLVVQVAHPLSPCVVYNEAK